MCLILISFNLVYLGYFFGTYLSQSSEALLLLYSTVISYVVWAWLYSDSQSPKLLSCFQQGLIEKINSMKHSHDIQLPDFMYCRHKPLRTSCWMLLNVSSVCISFCSSVFFSTNSKEKYLFISLLDAQMSSPTTY